MEQLLVYLEFILENINIKNFFDRSIEGYKQPLVKLFWQIFLIGLVLGLIITILDMFSPFKNKKVVADDD